MRIISRAKRVIEQVTDEFISCNICLEDQDYAREGIEIRGELEGYSSDNQENMKIPVIGIICGKCFREKILPLFPKGIQESWKDDRYPVYAGDEGALGGDITAIYFTGEKIGDEDQLFAVIAPFVEKGSYLEFLGEDGERWKVVFDGKCCETITQEEEIDQTIEDARLEGYNEALKDAEQFCLARRDALKDIIAKNEADKCAFGIRKMKKEK